MFSTFVRGVALIALALAAHAPVFAQKVKLTTSQGDIVIQLDAAKAPKTVENFMQYVKDGHYNGTIFHRVIENFMVQGGGFTPAYVEKKGRPPVAHEALSENVPCLDRNICGSFCRDELSSRI